MGSKLITAPSATPITTAEAKAHMRVSGSADDTYIAGLIAAAVEAAQNITRRQLVQAEYDFTLHVFPPSTCANPLQAIELPSPPLLEVAGLYYLDVDGVERQLASGAYVVDTYSLIPAIYPTPGTTWPATATDTPNAVRVRYSCGWAMNDNVSPPTWTGPDAIKTWLLVRVATLYEQREALVTGQAVAEVPRSFVDGLLDPYVIPMVV